jgi:hypothetical protein
MDTQRLEELIRTAGYTAEAYRYNSDTVVSVQFKKDGITSPLAPLGTIVYHCATPVEASDLVHRCYMRETPTTLVLFWPHAVWVL